MFQLFPDADAMEMERRVRLLCTFAASVTIEVLQSDVNNDMVANLVPHIALGLNSLAFFAKKSYLFFY